MDEFEKRERGAESVFAQDAALSFRIRIAALRKLGAWAGSKDAEALAARAIEGMDDATLIADLAREHPGVSAHRLRTRLAACLAEARAELHG